ncbi:bifunctional tetrahydrofolate synthase/dihydrofolate synthase [Parendozoicomonas sp. Alg238-R29]|uniref:bifunctional tetrahydrofolate synthase/dihydrofolate synthase n=1 Tax=Parendozoicomonas sp. Alg238-R29 TaxID=2993446 RepID=UPI00248E5F41|nr:bifunctional tetrahydrofolate synthase/dihydrofolate synthase [Parendozoicomonas sp. Alg238-R29]
MNAFSTSFPENPNSLSSWLAFLEARRPEHEMVLGLERADRTARKLLPASFYSDNRPVKVITVAGTNGKGSTVATLASVLKSAGIRAGSWTSPHLEVFNERICIDGEMVADQAICDSFFRIEKLRGDDFLSYFEFGALAALDIFFQENVDVILLEVGLGGRLDAVNIVDADVSIVTTVDLDHQAWLGDTIEKIAREKAGIFRTGRPAICGEAQPAHSLLEHINNIQAIELRASQAFYTSIADNLMTFRGQCFDGSQRNIEKLPVPSLPLTSVICALQALVWLFPDVTDDSIRDGLGGAQLAGRCQLVKTTNHQGEPVTVMLDVAHNPQAARFLAERVQALGETAPVAVLGMLDDKDMTGVLEPLKGCFRQWYTATVGYAARARTGADLADELVRFGESVTSYSAVKDALSAALESAKAGDHIVVLGSFHTVGESLGFLRSRRNSSRISS